MADGDVQRKRCVSCGGYYFPEFFRPANAKESSSANDAYSHYDRCIGCETLTKRKVKLDQRIRKKAKGTMSRHGTDLKKRGVIKDRGDLEELYGWSLDEMVKDIKHVLKGGCSYCKQKIDMTERGLGAVTLDICDPRKSPHYSFNVKWCCARCNSEKRATPLDVWGVRLSMWDLWRRHRGRVEDDPEAYGFLAYEKATGQSSLF